MAWSKGNILRRCHEFLWKRLVLRLLFRASVDLEACAKLIDEILEIHEERHRIRVLRSVRTVKGGLACGRR